MNEDGIKSLFKQYCKINLLSYPAPLCAITVESLFFTVNNQSQNSVSHP